MKKFLAVALSVVVVGGIAAPTIVSNAEGLTQAASPDEVNYGIVTKDDLTILKSLFDLEYYMAENPDIVELIGTDPDKLFEHFYTCGIFEGRTCNSNFDPAAYASAYSDVKEAFGLDIIRYYRQYATVGLVENRTLTTMEMCARAGITVTTLSEEPVKITPNVYFLASSMGTKDFKTVNAAVERAHVQQKMAVVETSTGTYVISSSKDVEKLKGFTAIGTVKAGDATLTYYVYDNSTGTAVYDGDIAVEGSVVVFKTSDAVEVTSSDYKGNISIDVGTYTQELSKEIENEISTGKHTSNMRFTSGENPHSGLYATTKHYPDVEDGDNILAMDVAAGYMSGATSNHPTYGPVGPNVVSEVYHVGGTIDDEGHKTPVPYEVCTDEYYQYLTDNNISTGTHGYRNNGERLSTGHISTMWVDTKGDADTEYTVCAGVEQEGNSKDVTIGIYNEESGTYMYGSIQIPNASQSSTSSGSSSTQD
ncbi:hypothetical protein [Pseudobutyrivibrio xylanivorans]|nr:hypothetical protein [Pseudobutyrivibrio xylanivorans]